MDVPAFHGERQDVRMFVQTSLAVRLLGAAALVAATARLVLAVRNADLGDLAPLTAYGFTVVFPLVLVALLLFLGPARTREGVLMRLGTAAQFVLIIAVPRYALHLLLGLPVVFLLVELFETRLPRRWREPVARLFVA